MPARTCVVVCHWVGRPAAALHRLLDQMRRIDPGAPFDLLIVVNGGDVSPLSLPARFSSLNPRILNRRNAGYNIGAWDAGWRQDPSPGHEFYLFLQDECTVKRPGWIADFEFRFDHDSGIGLLGESLMWDQMSWPYVRAATDRDLGSAVWPADEPLHPLDFYQAFLGELAIPPGDVATHLQSLILFTSRRMLEEIGGFPLGDSYRQAVACEIAVSRLIAQRGRRIAKVKDEAFALIGHSQWTARHQRIMRWRGRVAATLVRLGLKRPR